jgi:hypothetical protein
MDGVLCDFDKAFKPFKSPNVAYDRKQFSKAVLEHKIFEDLEYMPHALELLSHVKSISGITVEILTSVGTKDPTQGAEAARQKKLWLLKHGIQYKPNFVRMFSEKQDYAFPSTILIDDRPDCALPFTKAGGYGILHKDSEIKNTLTSLDSIVLQLKALKL